MAKRIHKGTGSPNVSETWQQTQRKRTERTVSGSEEDVGKETLGNDYWNRVAEDVASGYKTPEDESSVLNEDEVPGDNEKAD